MKRKSGIFEVMRRDAGADFDVGAIPSAEMQGFDEMPPVQRPQSVGTAAEPAEVEYGSPGWAGI
jgi:hypothetical protein